MALRIAIQDESGVLIKSIDDERNLLVRLTANSSLERQPFLASIDPYGDTIFNRLQIEPFLRELEILSATAQTAEERGLLNAIRELAQESLRDVHQYLVLIGD